MKKAIVLGLLILVCSLVLAGGALASNGFAIGRSVIGGGGQEVAGSGYILNGTLGEPIASDLDVGTNYGHCSGFWCGAGAEVGGPVYLPIILKGSGG